MATAAMPTRAGLRYRELGGAALRFIADRLMREGGSGASTTDP